MRMHARNAGGVACALFATWAFAANGSVAGAMPRDARIAAAARAQAQIKPVAAVASACPERGVPREARVALAGPPADKGWPQERRRAAC